CFVSEFGGEGEGERRPLLRFGGLLGGGVVVAHPFAVGEDVGSHGRCLHIGFEPDVALNRFGRGGGVSDPHDRSGHVGPGGGGRGDDGGEQGEVAHVGLGVERGGVSLGVERVLESV